MSPKLTCSSCDCSNFNWIEIVGSKGEIGTSRALIDQGSEISLVSEHLVQSLNLPRSRSSTSVIGIGGKKANTTKGSTQFTTRSRFDAFTEVSITVHILPRLTSSLPSTNIQNQNWPHLEGLLLADSNYTTPGSIDLILGADVYSQIIEDGIIKGDLHSPIAQRTKFGWILSGPVSINSSPNHFQGYHVTTDRELYDVLQQFWKLEEVPSSPTSSLSVDEQECERHYQLTHSRDQHG